MERCRLKGRRRQVNAVLSAAAMNFSKLLAALGALLSFLLLGSWCALPFVRPVQSSRRLPVDFFRIDYSSFPYPYSSECVEYEFCEVRGYKLPRPSGP